jgi:uncharacterized protein (DUF1501 family)
MLSRRQFIRHTSLISLSPLVPSFFSRIAHAASAEPDAKVLVVIQLDGGNDGINTVVPFGDDAYGRNRQALRLETEKLHKLNEHVGLHPQMKAAKQLFDDGRLTIVQGVGYPNPDRSHFRSMRIWQTARLDAGESDSYGWLGRALDEKMNRQEPGQPGAIYVGPESPPVTLWGRRSEAMTVTGLDDLKLPYSANQLLPASSKDVAVGSAEDALRLFTTQQVFSAYAAANQFQHQIQSKGNRSSAKYPESELASHLELISQLVKSGSAARVFYTSQSGYDTHASQLYTHAQLLRDLSEALKAFLDDLKNSKLDDRVVVLTFSEFGRRVKENDSQGTDHGAAAPMLLAGGKTASGLIGATPDLSDLDGGDVKMKIDLREVYAAILDNWLGIDSTAVLGRRFTKLGLFKSV